MRDVATTALDVLGILAVAVGLVFGLWPHIGGAAIACGGGFVLAVSAYVAHRAEAAIRQREAAR